MDRRDNRFEWQRFPDGEAFLSHLFDQIVRALPPVQTLAAELMSRTSTHLSDWLDHLVLADGERVRAQLVDLRFQPEGVPAEDGDTVYHHPGALFPRLLLRRSSLGEPGAALAAAVQVESVTEFLMMHQVAAPIEGACLSPYRRARVWAGTGREFWVVDCDGQLRWKKNIPEELGDDPHIDDFLIDRVLPEDRIEGNQLLLVTGPNLLDSGGRVVWSGRERFDHPQKVKRNIGYLPHGPVS